MSRRCDYCGGQLTKNPASGSGKSVGISKMCTDCRNLMQYFNQGINSFESFQTSEQAIDFEGMSSESLMRRFGRCLAKLEALEHEIKRRNSDYLRMIEGKKPESEDKQAKSDNGGIE